MCLEVVAWGRQTKGGRIARRYLVMPGGFKGEACSGAQTGSGCGSVVAKAEEGGAGSGLRPGDHLPEERRGTTRGVEPGAEPDAGERNATGKRKPEGGRVG